MSRGCSLDDEELDHIAAERPAATNAAATSCTSEGCSSGACASGSNADDRIPLSWREAKAGGRSGCGRPSSAAAALQTPRLCAKCRSNAPQVLAKGCSI